VLEREDPGQQRIDEERAEAEDTAPESIDFGTSKLPTKPIA